MKYQVTKTYGHEQGLSCVFRQWRATSHCNQLHGYAIAVKLVFGADALDSRNWVLDFGALKPVKEWLQQQFDHTTLVAHDDPNLREFSQLAKLGLLSVRQVPAVGCEAFAKQVAEYVQAWIPIYLDSLPCALWPLNLRLHEVEVREHGSNAASYFP